MKDLHRSVLQEGKILSYSFEGKLQNAAASKGSFWSDDATFVTP